MKILFVVGASMLAAMFQMPATPPVKMGLWESSVAMKMSGADMPPQMAGMGGRTTIVRSCYTPESYAKAMSNSQGDCTRTHEVWGAKSWSFDLSCRSGQATGHFEMTFDSQESAHGSMHMTMNAGGHSMQTDSTMTMHYLGADCGKVSPDRPEIVH
ncbi:MAG TPA: DUF3617 domain-containing protein [Acidobacteriaceae bacterium]|nr:DUF3617 domain-containing protein [Acidobacteriaceae bacterium]